VNSGLVHAANPYCFGKMMPPETQYATAISKMQAIRYEGIAVH
jgi:hypothetical protein